MDCRKVLLLLALAVLTPSSGCAVFNRGADPALPADPGKSLTSLLTVNPPASPDGETRKRTPKPATCVALGKYREDLAADAKCGPLEKQKYLDDARLLYQQALAIDPKHGPAYSALAHLYVELGDYDRALATYQKGLKLFPQEASLWVDLGMFHARKKEWGPSLTCMRKAVELDPENRQYSNVLGFCLARAGRYDESLAIFSKISGQAVACYNVGRMLHHNNQDDLSRQYLHQALQVNPQLAEAQQLLASLDRPGGVSGIATVGFQTMEPGNR